MSTWSINDVVRTPLLLMVGVESAILFSSVYVAAFIVFGNVADCERILGPLAPKAAIVTVVNLASLIAMGLYHFHQRIYFREAVVRVLVGVAVGCLVLAALFYVLPMAMISRDVASIAVGYALGLLLLVRYYFARTVDENVFRRRTMIYGAGERAASILDLRRRADRRGFRIVGNLAAPGDSFVGDKNILKANGKCQRQVDHRHRDRTPGRRDRRGNG
jgi:FlaA1/EpsC-like NDP-sugar epimerase